MRSKANRRSADGATAAVLGTHSSSGYDANLPRPASHQPEAAKFAWVYALLPGLGFVALGATAAQLNLLPVRYQLVWFEPIFLYLGVFWATLSILAAKWRQLSNRVTSCRNDSKFHRTVLGELEAPRLIRYALIALLLPPFVTIFAAVKQSIPVWNEFRWDEGLHAIDVVLHGGHIPTDLAAGLFRQPVVTVILDRTYYTWFPILVLTVTWFAWRRRDAIADRFLWSFFTCWILLGVAAAFLLSSAGPCFYNHVVPGPDPYNGLMTYLHEVDSRFGLGSILAQDYLWTGFSTGGFPTEGISAMPSMHVAMATLFCLSGFEVHRFLGAAYLVFMILILAGSVQLGWHYAVDGYCSVVLVWIIWWLSGQLFRSDGQEATGSN